MSDHLFYLVQQENKFYFLKHFGHIFIDNMLVFVKYWNQGWKRAKKFCNSSWSRITN